MDNNNNAAVVVRNNHNAAVVSKAEAIRPSGVKEYVELAKFFANSKLVPEAYQGKPEDCLVAMQMGAEVGLTPTQALQSIAVIGNRPTIWGDAALALVKGSGLFVENAHEEVIRSGDVPDDTAAYVTVQRIGGKPKVSIFSVKDAKRAGLWQRNQVWQKYPQRMLTMRARAFALRDTFPDVLKGIAIYEEVRDYNYSPIETIDDVAVPTTDRASALAKRLEKASQEPPKEPRGITAEDTPYEEVAAQPQPEDAIEPESEPRVQAKPKESPLLTAGQVRSLNIMASNMGLKNPHRIPVISRIIYRSVESTKDVTVAEATQIRIFLEKSAELYVLNHECLALSWAKMAEHDKQLTEQDIYEYFAVTAKELGTEDDI
tara:strand:+ start:17933 stop:19054 length:1122 start_codon:yes stop_codon:yes gene_type:complete